MNILSQVKFVTMKKQPFSPESLMNVFYKRNQVTWLELLNIIFMREASMFEKCALAKAIETLQTKSYIERLPGDTVQWTITETGRYQLSNYESGHQAFEMLGQTPN
jgi:hypothetical protein